MINDLKPLYRAGTYDRDRMDIALLRRISQYHTLQGPVKTLALIKQLPDPSLQEAAIYLMAARAVVEDKGPELFKETGNERFQRSIPTNLQSSLARGYVAGIEAAPPALATASKEPSK